jgi:hypothetical protein
MLEVTARWKVTAEDKPKVLPATEQLAEAEAQEPLEALRRLLRYRAAQAVRAFNGPAVLEHIMAAVVVVARDLPAPAARAARAAAEMVSLAILQVAARAEALLDTPAQPTQGVGAAARGTLAQTVLPVVRAW